MRTTCLTSAVLLLATGTAEAETLYNQDGVRLSATVQEIDPAARPAASGRSAIRRRSTPDCNPTTASPSTFGGWNSWWPTTPARCWTI